MPAMQVLLTRVQLGQTMQMPLMATQVLQLLQTRLVAILLTILKVKVRMLLRQVVIFTALEQECGRGKTISVEVSLVKSLLQVVLHLVAQFNLLTLLSGVITLT